MMTSDALAGNNILSTQISLQLTDLQFKQAHAQSKTLLYLSLTNLVSTANRREADMWREGSEYVAGWKRIRAGVVASNRCEPLATSRALLKPHKGVDASASSLGRMTALLDAEIPKPPEYSIRTTTHHNATSPYYMHSYASMPYQLDWSPKQCLLGQCLCYSAHCTRPSKRSL